MTLPDPRVWTYLDEYRYHAGCSGNGGRRYPQFGGWSGAKIASRLLGNTLADWFQSGDMGARGTGHAPPETLAEGMRRLLSAKLREVKSMIPPQESAVVSRLSKTIPSTLTAASNLLEWEASLRRVLEQNDQESHRAPWLGCKSTYFLEE